MAPTLGTETVPQGNTSLTVFVQRPRREADKLLDILGSLTLINVDPNQLSIKVVGVDRPYRLHRDTIQKLRSHEDFCDHVRYLLDARKDDNITVKGLVHEGTWYRESTYNFFWHRFQSGSAIVHLNAHPVQSVDDVAGIPRDSNLPIFHLDLGVIKVIPRPADKSYDHDIWTSYCREHTDGSECEISKPSEPTYYRGPLLDGTLKGYLETLYGAHHDAYVIRAVHIQQGGRWFQRTQRVPLSTYSCPKDWNRLQDIRVLGAVVEVSEQVRVDTALDEALLEFESFGSVERGENSYRLLRDRV